MGWHCRGKFWDFGVCGIWRGLARRRRFSVDIGSSSPPSGIIRRSGTRPWGDLPFLKRSSISCCCLLGKNPTWGYERIQGTLANLGHPLSDQTVGNFLREHGIEPAPERKRGTSWQTFLKSHWESIGAIDFTTVEVWTMEGLVTMYILVVMELKT